MSRIDIAGVVYDEPNGVYHANKEYDSFSNVKTFIKSVELYRKATDGLIPTEKKKAWDIGNAVHTAILEPHKLGEYHFVEKGFNGATKAGKAVKADCKERGVTMLNGADSETYRDCVKSLKTNASFKLFAQGEPEVTFRVWSDRIKLQCRTDWLCLDAPSGLEEFGINEGDNYVADLKTTRSLDDWLSTSKWKNPLTSDVFFYSGQEVFYKFIIDNVLNASGIKSIDKWVFVVVEKEEPFRTAVFTTPPHVIAWADNKVSESLNEIVRRNESNCWIDERLSGAFEPSISI